MGAVVEAQDALNWLHDRFFSHGPATAKTTSTKGRALPGDADLLEKIRRSKTGPEFERLWSGDSGQDASGADFRLCSILAFWTGKDARRIDVLFRQSGLFRNEGRAGKWDKKHHADGSTYGERTVDKAIEATTETYQGGMGTKPPVRRPPPLPNSNTGQEGQERPVIRIIAGELPQAVRAAMGILVAARVPIYQRGAALWRPVIVERPRTGQAGHIPAGALLLETVNEVWLADQVTQAAQLEKYDKRVEDWLRCDCPPRLAKTLQVLAGEWRFPPLVGVIEAPTLREDGSLVAADGYDKQTALYLHLPPGLKVAVASAPTRDDAIAAFQVLEREIFGGFPFASRADLSVAIAATLTALVRRLLRIAPGFVFDAPVPGSGKTLLADIVAILATGRPAPIMSQASNDDENEKRLASFLLQGHSMLNMDNVGYPISGDFLCSMLTSPEINPRILGESHTPSLQTNLTFMATGNNVAARGDISRRLLVCRLDPHCERPDARRFDRDLYAWLPEHRGAMLSHALTILKAFQLAGFPEPDPSLGPYGSFNEWSTRIRAAVVWLGLPDPCQTRTRLEGADHVTGQLAAVLSAWHRELRGQVLTIGEVRERCSMAIHADLRAALLDVASAPRDLNAIDPRRLSHWLKRVEGRVIGQLRFARRGEIRARDQWTVEVV
jgi:putative DNA primase/helicase